MRLKVFGGGLAVMVAAWSVCLITQAAAPAPTVHEWMTRTVAPQSAALWELVSKVTDDEGDPGSTQLTDAEWAAIAGAAQAVERSAAAMAGAERIVAVAPGVTILDEGKQGASSATLVNGYVAKDLEGFRVAARALSAGAADFAESARTRDAARLEAASEDLAEVCQACHVRFWYPDKAGAEQ